MTLHEDDVFSEKLVRENSHFPKFQVNITRGMDQRHQLKFKKWMVERIQQLY